MLTSALAIVYAFPLIGPLVQRAVNNIKMVAIFAAILLITNFGTGVVYYIKGHNAAAAQCKIGSLIRERDEARRDRDTAVSTSSFLKTQLDAINTRQSAREQKDTEDAAKLPTVVGCTVPPLPRSRVRHR
jgi:hypothetical protein